MQVLFDGELPVSYRSIHLVPADHDHADDLAGAAGGQANGLVGARHPGTLSFVTGLHSGPVPLRIEAHDEEPPDDGGWEDVVEVSYAPVQADVALVTFQDWEGFTLPGTQGLRVRWCASGMDTAQEQDTRLEGEPAPDRYLLQLWPAPPAPDAVLRVGSRAAQYWHDEARRTPPPPAREERDAALTGEPEELRLGHDARDAFLERLQWGEVPPSDALRRAGDQAAALGRWDRRLAEDLAAAPAAVQRAVALEVSRGACARAGLDGAPEVVAALDALRAGRPVPPPFDDHAAAYAWAYPGPLHAEVREVRAVGTARVLDATAPEPEHPAVDPAASAVGALLAAGSPDPAAAAVGVVAAATWARPDREALVAQVRALLG
ncbi:hypothetical protein [Vallicoccus soli]|uniref:hypothetical protein n=1 Tax=Vallicoccus soli TaxID=2339232 RepID=UPI00105A27C6|nr:hypothetical protein [Vallicoccus soli]